MYTLRVDDPNLDARDQATLSKLYKLGYREAGEVYVIPHSVMQHAGLSVADFQSVLAHGLIQTVDQHNRIIRPQMPILRSLDDEKSGSVDFILDVTLVD